MAGFEAAAEYLFARETRSARGVTGEPEGWPEALERLHEVVTGRLGDDPALARLREEAVARAPWPRERTVHRLALALEDAAEQDPEFAAELRAALDRAHSVAPTAPRPIVVHNTINGGVFHGQIIQHDVHLDAQPASGAPPGPPFGDDEEDA
ncbi:hypothetical protein AB0K51_04755 [Kitasatospora sp. NPDC049285]|uniref:hypothetical protein n=1 Tax=Kitasatospora sp. NPDC049285 TaxID=3157096 RepID=UPI0034263FF7